MRNSYFDVKLFSAAISTQQRFKVRDFLGRISGEAEKSRRRANEALRFSLNTVDVQSEKVTKNCFPAMNARYRFLTQTKWS